MARSARPSFWIVMVALLGGGCPEAKVLDSQSVRLSALSPDEHELLCEDYEPDPDERMQRAYCLALATGAEAQYCESWFDHCMQTPLEVRCQDNLHACWHPLFGAPAGQPGAYCEPAHLGSCSATVGEWRGCADESVEAIERSFADRTCADLPSLDDAAELALAALNPPRCEALLERCPGLSPTFAPGFSGTATRVDHGSLSEDSYSGVFEIEFETGAGAVRHLSSWGGDGCGTSAGLFIDHSPFVGHDFCMPDDLDFIEVMLLSADYPPDTDVAGDAVDLVLYQALRNIPTSDRAWTGHDGCTADVSTSPCEREPGMTGVRYRFTNGSCSAPLEFDPAGGAADVRVMWFAARTGCVVD